MAKNYVQPGQIVTVPAPDDVSSGDFVKVGSLFGVAQTDAASGDDVPLAVEGVYTLPKSSSDLSAGDPVYWSTSASNITGTAASNWYVGVAVEDAGTSASSVAVRLNGAMPAAAEGA